MGSPIGSQLNRLKGFMRSPWPAAVLVTLVTLGAVGAILVVATPTGCRLAQNAGVHLNGAKCQKPSTAAVLASPSPSPGYGSATPPGGDATPLPVPSPIPTPSPSSSNVPHNSSLPPYEFDVSSSAAYPPNYPDASAAMPADVAISCRLPIYAGGPGSGGFLVFPDRKFIGDPRSGVAVPSPSPGSPTPAPTYGPQGFYGLSYVRALSRWVPVPRAWVAPDGKHYAYPDPTGGIYLVDIASNTQTEIAEGRRWSVLDVEAEGVYAVEQNVAGLWLVPFAGTPSQLTNLGYWTAIGGGAAYGTETSALPNGVATLIERFDLKTRTRQHWFQVDNATSYLYGFDAAGHPIFMVQGMGPGPITGELWLVTGLSTAQVLVYNINFGVPVVADSHGIWIMSYQATYLLVPGRGMYLAANVGGQLGGGCA